ncbi:hypothetical protein BJF79_03485 [Actinomadura sp. CNU-125]|uniref:hypothetical protein n=1 Tax=Actinomadura sp. CNU-125 TaxID=1904961 RepID=UPI000963BFD5|nr:hypothetical protein [Actinomadura sp. CNU-125]OLT12976.1 hypothetical protein BJF79_03485 [Actinomadura sp. CNU-125]
MGMSTSIIVHNQLTDQDTEKLFAVCRETIGARRRHRWHEGPSNIMRGAREYTMVQDQGLPVWLRVFYTTRGVLPSLDSEQPYPEHTLEVWFLGGTDHALHERIRKTIGDWLTEQGFTWQWSNDYGERTWHRGS